MDVVFLRNIKKIQQGPDTEPERCMRLPPGGCEEAIFKQGKEEEKGLTKC